MWEVIQVQERIACRLRESHLRRDDETLTAHKFSIRGIFPIFQRTTNQSHQDLERPNCLKPKYLKFGRDVLKHDERLAPELLR